MLSGHKVRATFNGKEADWSKSCAGGYDSTSYSHVAYAIVSCVSRLGYGPSSVGMDLEAGSYDGAVVRCLL
jgi:hypothetical protein